MKVLLFIIIFEFVNQTKYQIRFQFILCIVCKLTIDSICQLKSQFVNQTKYQIIFQFILCIVCKLTIDLICQLKFQEQQKQIRMCVGI
jgi:hypothetical protein